VFVFVWVIHPFAAFFERFQGRSDLLKYAEANGVPVVQTKAKPYSMDENMFHISYEAGVLEDPAVAPADDMFRMTTSPEDSPDQPEYVAVTFEAGVPTLVENITEGHTKSISNQLDAFLYLNEVAGKHGVGRVDVVENRFVGIKSRGVYETPAGEVLRTAHIGLEGLTLDREVFRLRDTMAAKFTEYAYNGFWFSPEMKFVLNAVEASQQNVTGRVVVKLFKGRASIHSRESPMSLYDEKIVSMDIAGGYNPADAEGFIKINSIRLKAHAAREKALGREL
jgi:argininosuccinate synthase